VNRFESSWLSWSPNSTRTGGDATDKTDRRAFVGSVGRVARASETSRSTRNLGHFRAGSPTRPIRFGFGEHSTDAPPAGQSYPCSYFLGGTIKGPCARCGHTYREHLKEADGEGKP
jgi:hypothetical protein